MSRNQQAQAVAIRRAVAKSKKIKELGITPKLSVKQRDALILKLSEGKAAEEGKDLKEFLKGQEWYVKDLMAFSALSADERFEYEYSQAFPEVASEEEAVDAIAAAM